VTETRSSAASFELAGFNMIVPICGLVTDSAATTAGTIRLELGAIAAAPTYPATSSGAASSTVVATATVPRVREADPSASRAAITQQTSPSQKRLRPDPVHTEVVSAPIALSSRREDATATRNPSSASTRPGTARLVPGRNSAISARTTGTARSAATTYGAAPTGTESWSSRCTQPPSPLSVLARARCQADAVLSTGT